MSETVLNYDKIIWEIFAIGITTSIVILYKVISLESKIPENFRIYTLILGFSILIYSFILSLGYGVKKDKLIACFRELNSDYKLENKMSEKLNNSWRPRVKWMAEIIMILIIVFYFILFIMLGNIYIPIIILLIALLLCCIVNCCRKKKSKEWKGCFEYIKSYFDC